MVAKFSESAMTRIARAVRWVESQKPPSPTRREIGSRRFEFFIGKTGAGGIPARSGGTVGSAIVSVYRTNGTTLSVQYDANSNPVTETCYNLSTVAVGSDAYIMMQREYLSGKMFAVWEDC